MYRPGRCALGLQHAGVGESFSERQTVAVIFCQQQEQLELKRRDLQFIWLNAVFIHVGILLSVSCSNSAWSSLALILAIAVSLIPALPM